MLHITIKDIETGEFIYYEDVSMVIMLAAEKDGIRSIRHTTKAASVDDIVGCVNAIQKEAKESKSLLAKAFAASIEKVIFDEDNNE